MTDHEQLGLTEGREATSNTDWLIWANTVESLLGHSLDGDQTADLYSLDGAHYAYTSGTTPSQYVNLVQTVREIKNL